MTVNDHLSAAMAACIDGYRATENVTIRSLFATAATAVWVASFYATTVGDDVAALTRLRSAMPPLVTVWIAPASTETERAAASAAATHVLGAYVVLSG